MNKRFKMIAAGAMLVFAMNSCAAQMKNVKSAEYAIDGENGNNAERVLEAKGYIDAAYTDPKTSSSSRMWITRAVVYSRLYNLRSNELLRDVSGRSGYASGYSMMQYFKSADKKLEQDEEMARLECVTSFGVLFNESGDFYAERRNFDTMVDYYRVALYLYDQLLKVDTASVNSLAGQKVTRKSIVEDLARFASACQNAQLKKEVLRQLVDEGNKQPIVFDALSRAYLTEGDTVSAEKVVREGLDRAPGDNNMFMVLVNFYITINKVSKLMADVSRQIETSPDSKLYFIRGFLLEQDTKYDAAIADYRKAIELDEFNYDANFNLGLAMMKYESKKYYDKMGSANSTAMKQIKADLAKLFTESRGYLERAAENKDYTINEQLDIHEALLRCAQELGDESGAATYKEKIEALKAAR